MIDFQLVAPEAGFIVENGVHGSDDLDRTDSEASLIIIEIIELFTWVEDKGAPSIVAMLVEYDGSFEVTMGDIGAPLQLEAEVGMNPSSLCLWNSDQTEKGEY